MTISNIGSGPKPTDYSSILSSVHGANPVNESIEKALEDATPKNSGLAGFGDDNNSYGAIDLFSAGK